MERKQSKSYYKFLVLLVGLVCAQWAKANYYSVSENRLSHYLGMSVSGGFINRIGNTNKQLHGELGGAAHFALHYEMQYRKFFWGVALETAFLNINSRTAFKDTCPRIDIDGDDYSYQYVYTSYREKDMIANFNIPIYAGMKFGQVYASLGVRFTIPLWAQYTMNSSMYTQGVYSWNIEPIVSTPNNDFSSLGFYPEKDYAYKNLYEESLHIAPFVEVGYEFYRTDKVNMRVGGYVSYALPIASFDKKPLVDYSNVDTNPHTQNQLNMEQNIQWNPMVLSDKYLSMVGQLELGAKLTMLFNVTKKGGKCMCVK